MRIAHPLGVRFGTATRATQPPLDRWTVLVLSLLLAACGGVETASTDAVGQMEIEAFGFADAVGDSDPEAVDAVFALYESAQQFIETGESGDVSAEGELVDALGQDCMDAGF